jgi:magnesium chelatase family protein
MSVCRARSLSLFGIEALPVEVEVDVSSGLPGFSIVGLPDAAVQEARERVRVAISNSGYKFPTKKVIVNLAPANLRKEGPAFDLPIALGILAASVSHCFYGLLQGLLLQYPWCTWCTSVVYVSIHKHLQPI